jgi:hypothetical protein
MPVQIDPEVGGEYEREPATLLDGGFLDCPFMDSEVGADEGGVGAVEEIVEAVGGTGHREGLGERELRERVPMASRPTPVPSAGAEEKTQPLEGARDKVAHVDAPCKRWPCPGRSSHLAGVFPSSTLHLSTSLCIQVQRDPHDRAGSHPSTLDI